MTEEYDKQEPEAEKYVWSEDQLVRFQILKETYEMLDHMKTFQRFQLNNEYNQEAIDLWFCSLIKLSMLLKKKMLDSNDEKNKKAIEWIDAVSTNHKNPHHKNMRKATQVILDFEESMGLSEIEKKVQLKRGWARSKLKNVGKNT